MANQAPSDPLVGRILSGRYRLEQRIAEGGMGMVYLATQVQLNRSVAVKLIRPSILVAHPNLGKRFMMEAAALAKLVHSNIVTVYDYGETEEGELYIAMELLPGRSLADVVRTEGPLSFRRIVRISVQVARALRQAHAVGVIHRDLKPENVMLMPAADDADDDLVKVLDFGVAKIVEPSPTLEAIEETGFVGSPAYVPPEHVVGGGAIDQRSDVYALGCLQFFMVTGKPPFVGETPVQIIRQHLEAVVPEMYDVGYRRECPRSLEKVIVRCLEKQPDDRYASMSEVVGELKTSYAALPRGMSGERNIGLRHSSDLGPAGPTTPMSTTPIPYTPIPATPLPGASPFVDRSIHSLTEADGVVAAPRRSKLPVIFSALAFLLALVSAGYVLFLQRSEPPPPALVESSVSFSSTPEGATVLHDGRSLGRTPFSHVFAASPDGTKKSFTFQLEGHERVTVLAAPDRSDVNVTATLPPLPPPVVAPPPVEAEPPPPTRTRRRVTKVSRSRARTVRRKAPVEALPGERTEEVNALDGETEVPTIDEGDVPLLDEADDIEVLD